MTQTANPEISKLMSELASKNATMNQAIDDLKAKQEKLIAAGGDENLKDLKAAIKQLEDQHTAGEKKLADAIKSVTDAKTHQEKQTGGFDSFGEFAQQVKSASAKGATTPEKLNKWHAKAPTTVANEASGVDGGYLVPTEFATTIMELAFGDESVLAQTNNIPLSRNSISIPVSEATPWGSNGVTAHWIEEGGQLTQSRPRFEMRHMRLFKLAAFVPASDELLEDSTALEAFISGAASKAIRYHADDAIYWGDGVGKPLGIYNSNALVSVAKKSGQAADTIVIENILNMFSRMLPTSMSNSGWDLNPDTLPQLMLLTIGNNAVWLPGGMIQDAPYGLLLGRPVRPSVHMKTLGDKGDILFSDKRQYMTISKGIKTATSIHLWFDYDVMAFRFIFRINGQPWLSAPITTPNSAATLSPFVTLDARA